jgi:hypothetical protein
MNKVRILHPPLGYAGHPAGHPQCHDGFIYGKQIICERCAIQYTKFLKSYFHTDSMFCTCNECKEKLKEIEGTTVRCAWCNDPIFIVGVQEP